ncbi:AMP-binding protein [Galbitalea soli]|uniref:4-coumarate--CoA ligase family protein n=1 Tax=Galbitalea soli TaxID=1268042 RepID=A0A7C9TRW3_9MICO|nr:AMP-binding protein [Galbitalea soli]NEM92517.1 4-coumarate--CoA ligase family protein [Galbitalea soli]NYJ29554.1 4-coumarate--CoA ligase [Galbitalea soli]
MPSTTYPDATIPDQSVYDFLFGDLAEEDLDRVVLIDGPTGNQVSYRQFVAQIDAVAGALAARGATPGTVVGLLCPNAPAFAIVFHGILRAGCIVTTINSLYTADEIANQLRDADAHWLFTVSPLLGHAAEAAAAVGLDAEHLVVMDGADGHPSLRDLIAQGAPAPEVHLDPATQIAVLPYSSGTTGRPKGVMLSHRNLVANVVQSGMVIGLTRSDRVLAVLPFFHIYGLTVLLNYAIKQRASLVTMPRFDLPEFLRNISEQRCTWVFIAPPIAVALAKHPIVDQYDVSSIDVIFSGAAPLDATLAGLVADRLRCRVRQGYGMTELSPVSHAIPVERDDISLDSIGVPLPNVECRLVDVETGADIPMPEEGVSAPGELLVRGPNVMLGYLHNAEATTATLEPDGWLHTGDIATVAADGTYYVVDRLKELIKYKGYQVAPAVLEAVLLGHPEIADAAVIGVPDDDAQEIPKAFVVVQAGAALTADDVIAYVAERVAPHEKVRRVEFIDVVPKTTSGKILRKDLRAKEREAAAAKA